MPTPWNRFLLTGTCILIRTLIITAVYNAVIFLTSSNIDARHQLASTILQFFICTHHGLSMWWLWLNPAILDWLLILCELGAWFGLKFYTRRVDRWTASTDVVLVSSLFVQMLALISLWLIRSITLIRKSSLSPCLPLPVLDPNYDPGRPQPNKTFYMDKRLQLFLGKALWPDDKGKQKTIMILRTTFALSTFFGMLIFAIFCLLIWPITEEAMVPVKTLTSSGIRWDFQSLNPSWNVFVLLDGDFGTSVVDVLPDAIRVTPLWEDLDQQVELCAPDGPPPDEKPQCINNGRQYTDDDDFPSKYNTVETQAVYSYHYFCPNRCTRDLSFLDFIRVPSRDTMPDLMITVNFTTLGIPPMSSTVGGSQLKSVGIVIAFINNVGDVLRVTTPTSLLPGMHLMGRVNMVLRSVIAHPSLAALGPVSPSRSFIAGDVYHLTQDPAPPSQDLNTATLRLFVPTDPSDWNFIQEEHEKTVLLGFTTLGGLWTSVNGIFSVLFGGTLALWLWGKKPFLSIGILERRQKQKLLEEWREKIRDFRAGCQCLDEIDLIMIKVLRERFVNLGPLEEV